MERARRIGTRREIPVVRDPSPISAGPSLLFVLGVLVLYTVSGGMLWLVGVNYDGVTGSAISKLHPGTYIVAAAFALAAIEAGNPIAFGAELVRYRPAAFVLLIATVVLFVDIVVHAGPGMAGTLDTFLLPPLAVGLFAKSNTRTRSRIELVIHVAMIANALLGLVEFGTTHLYFPYRFDGALLVTDTRSTALQGHPLGNATITSFYILALLAGGGRLSPAARGSILLLEFFALVVFGGRSALVTTAVLGGIQGLVFIINVVRSRRIPIGGVLIALLIATAAPLVIIGLVSGGFFDALLNRFASDGGSANARVEMLTLVQQIPLADLLVGPDPGLVESLRRVNGLMSGIENPIVRTILYQGAILTGIMIVALGFFLYELMRTSRRGMALPMLGFLIVINTFESLGSKSTLLAKFAVMMLVLFRRSQREVASPNAWMMPGSKARDVSSIRPILSKRFQKAQPNSRASAASRTSRT
jgi:hypothetical protein